ncbi:sulfur carrier protein ThiS [Methylophaga sp.]|uniref:sulfur carrier protein ThiS n=1 Tax=Methylophaga sp. TaxID=2024840 RepID=UPI003F6A38E0
MTSNQTVIEVNGESTTIDANQTVQSFLEGKGMMGGRFVVVLNDEFVPKSSWSDTRLNSGDQVDIMSPISGG